MKTLTNEQLRLVFEKVVETCEKKLYDPKLNGVNWRQIADERARNAFSPPQMTKNSSGNSMS